MDLNNLSVFPQGVAVSDVRRELMFWKKIKIPWSFEYWRTLVEFVCHHWSVRVTLLYRSMLFEGNTQRGRGHSHTYGIVCLCWGKGHGFEVGYQLSPVDVTYNCIHGWSLDRVPATLIVSGNIVVCKYPAKREASWIWCQLMLLNFQCHRSENNTVDPFLPLIVFVFFLELDIIFFSSASNRVYISCTSS